MLHDLSRPKKSTGEGGEKARERTKEKKSSKGIFFDVPRSPLSEKTHVYVKILKNDRVLAKNKTLRTSKIIIVEIVEIVDSRSTIADWVNSPSR